MNASGALDPLNGITEYIVGTGGESLQALSTSAVPQPLAYRKTFGYLRIALHPAGWDAQFIDSAGNILDTSVGLCHG